MKRLLFTFLAIVSVAHAATDVDTRVAFLLGVHSSYGYEHGYEGFFPSEQESRKVHDEVASQLLKGPSATWHSEQELLEFLQESYVRRANGEPGFFDKILHVEDKAHSELALAFLSGVRLTHKRQNGFHVLERDKAAYVLQCLARLELNVHVDMVFGYPGGSNFSVEYGDIEINKVTFCEVLDRTGQAIVERSLTRR